MANFLGRVWGVFKLLLVVGLMIYFGNKITNVQLSDGLLQAAYFAPAFIGIWLLLTGSLLFVYSPPSGATKEKFSLVESLLLLLLLSASPLILETVIRPARWSFSYTFALAGSAAAVGFVVWFLLTRKGKRI